MIGYNEGKNGIASIKCKEGEKSVLMGRGFTQTQRENPLKIGEIITYKYHSKNVNGIPHSAIFLRGKKAK